MMLLSFLWSSTLLRTALFVVAALGFGFFRGWGMASAPLSAEIAGLRQAMAEKDRITLADREAAINAERRAEEIQAELVVLIEGSKDSCKLTEAERKRLIALANK